MNHPQFEIQVTGDVAFGQSLNELGEMETLRLDLYMPVDDHPAPRPAIFWFHGGGFRPGNDKRQVYIPRFANAFAARGYVGIAPDYRVRQDPTTDWKGSILDAVADARMALDWVKSHAAEYRIDPQRIALAGGSAGGMTITNLVHNPQQPILRKDGVFAVVNLWGSPDGQNRYFDRIDPAAPAHFVVHGTADELVPYQNSVRFTQDLRQAGINVQHLTLPGAPHTPLKEMDLIVKELAQFLIQHDH